jgi:hypothetical protein
LGVQRRAFEEKLGMLCRSYSTARYRCAKPTIGLPKPITKRGGVRDVFHTTEEYEEKRKLSRDILDAFWDGAISVEGSR